MRDALPRPHRGRGLPADARDRARRSSASTPGSIGAAAARAGPARPAARRDEARADAAVVRRRPRDPDRGRARGRSGRARRRVRLRPLFARGDGRAAARARVLRAARRGRGRDRSGSRSARSSRARRCGRPRRSRTRSTPCSGSAAAACIAGLGAGDSQSRAENETFGLEFGYEVDRVNALRTTLRALRGHGYPVWVGGRAAPGRPGRGRRRRRLEPVGRSSRSSPASRRGPGARARGVARAASLTAWGGLVLLGAPRPKPRRSGRGSVAGPTCSSAGPSRSPTAARLRRRRRELDHRRPGRLDESRERGDPRRAAVLPTDVVGRSSAEQERAAAEREVVAPSPSASISPPLQT